MYHCTIDSPIHNQVCFMGRHRRSAAIWSRSQQMVRHDRHRIIGTCCVRACSLSKVSMHARVKIYLNVMCVGYWFWWYIYLCIYDFFCVLCRWHVSARLGHFGASTNLIALWTNQVRMGTFQEECCDWHMYFNMAPKGVRNHFISFFFFHFQSQAEELGSAAAQYHLGRAYEHGHLGVRYASLFSFFILFLFFSTIIQIGVWCSAQLTLLLIYFPSPSLPDFIR